MSYNHSAAGGMNRVLAGAAVVLVCALGSGAFAQFTPVNDNCIDAIPIFNGPTNYNTTGANTDGPQHGPGGPCQFNGQTYHDIWYNYTADFTGLLTVSTCNEDGGNGNYDTDLVLYDGCDCLNLILLGCNDDASGPCSGGNEFLSRKVVPVVAGNCYIIRVGGWNPGDQGTGTVSLVKSLGPGACCLPDGSCQDSDAEACAAAGGTFQGAGSTCEQGDCPDPAVYFWTTDQAEFEAEVAAAGKVTKGTENFPWTAPDGQFVLICDPFDTTDAVPGWIEPGVLLDNLTWQANLGGADPTFPNPRCPVTGQNSLFAGTPPGLLGWTDTVLSSFFFADAFDIISGPPAGDNHTAMAMTVVAVLGVQTVNVTVFDEGNVNLGTVTNVPAPVTGGGFFGIIMPQGVTIGRVNLFDASNGAEGVYNVTVYIPVGVLTLDLDIKPGSCPNSFNRNSNGVLPVALVGTDTFDPTDVDLSTVLLTRADGVGGSVASHEGPPGPHSEFEDVATPFDGQPCDCHELGGDGVTDLSMKFKTDDVVAALQLNDLPAGDLVELVVSGALLDGTPFSASDCIRLVPPGTSGGLLAVGSNLPGAWVDVSPLDLQLDGGGFGNFERTYPLTTVVTLTAPAMYHGWVFSGWLTDDGLYPGQSIDITITIGGSGFTFGGEPQSATALYAPAGPTTGTIVP